jgi:hypothetical protein
MDTDSRPQWISLVSASLHCLFGSPNGHKDLFTQTSLLPQIGIAYVYKLDGLCFAKLHTGWVTITELALDQFFFYKIIGNRSKGAGLQAKFATDA